MRAASAARSRVSAAARIGEIAVDSRLTLYVTHVTGRPSAMDTMMGSSAVRWLHTRREPGVPGRGGGGGAPRTARRMPVRR
ncbi:Os02g0114300 [Oryza sativa Japonica Group]|uniref:Os02g0114300 protein n=1 Tax=Oryza sativa subsp. japonica TaxID=39947 RepID=A0A0P0VDV5_ORYSJ|nr:hypothetical protein EE612_008411 [Oryza sativa]BAS76639.1 Os02g0114300 [Oryza sativa Japonica Group]